MNNKNPYVAGGTILPCRFLVASTSADFTALQASTAGAVVFGISQEGSKIPPIDGWTDSISGNACVVGDPVPYWGEHDEALLELGGTVTAGALLSTDANGKGVVSSTSGHAIGARALQAGSSGEKIRVAIETQRKVA